MLRPLTPQLVLAPQPQLLQTLHLSLQLGLGMRALRQLLLGPQPQLLQALQLPLQLGLGVLVLCLLGHQQLVGNMG